MGMIELLVLLLVVGLLVFSFLLRWRRLKKRGQPRLSDLFKPVRNSGDP